MGQGQSTQTPARRPTREPAFVTKGAVRVCPHRKVRYWETCSWKPGVALDSQQSQSSSVVRHVCIPWKCTECIGIHNHVPYHGDPGHLTPPPTPKADELPFGAKPPGIELEPGASSDSMPRIIKSWRVPIFQCGNVTGNLLLTSDFVSSSLEIARRQYPHLVCQHSTFTDEAFIAALKTEADIVHKGPSGVELLDVHLGREPKRADNEGAVAVCPRCSAEYKWLKRDTYFLIEGRHDISSHCLPPGSKAATTALISVGDPDSGHPGDEHLKIMARLPSIGRKDAAENGLGSSFTEGGDQVFSPESERDTGSPPPPCDGESGLFIVEGERG